MSDIVMIGVVIFVLLLFTKDLSTKDPNEKNKPNKHEKDKPNKPEEELGKIVKVIIEDAIEESEKKISDQSHLADTLKDLVDTLKKLPDSPYPNQPGIKEMLIQLKEAISSEKSLCDYDKDEALKQVNTLACAGQHPSNLVMLQPAKQAAQILREIIDKLPSAAKLAVTYSKLSTEIATILGL